ncbi:MAG: hypothetical protein EOO40_06765 [Deltaproteobacteria bacterium]|nr:MAG: hypothetical protein EOO40_06765 [Deltaproteobacteria bacterium]
MTQRKTQTATAMAARLESLDPATPRYGILAAAREFKASWVELGERLTAAREKEAYAAWGYPSFEAYCRRELQIKQDTANKLTRSFSYLRDHEPKVLDAREGRSMPALDVVDLLSQAKERTEISADAFDSIREQAMDPEARVTRAAIMKKFREADPDAFRPAAKPKDVSPPGPNDLRKALLLAERLQSVLTAQEGDVFNAAATKAAAVVAELKARFAAMEGGAGPALATPHRPGTPHSGADDVAAVH